MSFALQGWGFAPIAERLMRYDMGTNEDGPAGALTPGIRASTRTTCLRGSASRG